MSKTVQNMSKKEEKAPYFTKTVQTTEFKFENALYFLKIVQNVFTLHAIHVKIIA